MQSKDYQKLLNCPFCGGEAILESNKLRYGTIYSAYCQKCGAEITGFSEHEAVAAWNRRAKPANEPLTLKQPEIVRCKDYTYYCPASDGHGGEMHYGFCINRHDGTCGVTRNRYERDFCSYGERKDGGDG